MTIPKKQNHTADVRVILEVVCAFYSKAIKEVVGTRRLKSLVVPRHVAIYFMRRYSDLTLEEIGKHFTSLDHTSVLHAVRSVGECAARDSDIAAQVGWIERELNRIGEAKSEQAKREEDRMIENLVGLA